MRIKRRRYETAILDMTPTIDVVFLLLIFFLTTSQLAQMAESPVALPLEVGTVDASPTTAGLVVNVSASGTLTVFDRDVGPTELPEIAKSALAQDPSAIPVIRADRNATAARLNEVMEGLRSGGCSSVRVATSTPEGGSP
ncbi:MAG: biopolymer transporter ExbD [Phycisphaerales bacterium]|nr:biopolymer transporter ExbD [Phycisphaerales bacterium]